MGDSASCALGLAAKDDPMYNQFTIEEETRLRAAVAELRRLLDALRVEMAEMRKELDLPPQKTKSLRAMGGGAVD